MSRRATAAVALVVITGHSGAGKSEAIAAFEDGGYFCVDNLPPRMIDSLGELFRHEGSGVERAAVVSDVRGGEYFDELLAVLDDLDGDGLKPQVLFLEADEETLLDRYKETRRRHPLAPEGRIVDGIRAERELLAPLRERADVVMDTSDLTGGELRRRIAEEMLGGEDGGKLALTLLTFGFKNGPPRDADLTLDVRFLPNPHYVDELRPLTGLDEEVRDYVESGTQAGEFYGRLMPLLEFLVPAYVAEGKSHLTIAIGCTGGRHRSVTVADRIRRDLADRDDVIVRVKHRDVELDGWRDEKGTVGRGAGTPPREFESRTLRGAGSRMMLRPSTASAFRVRTPVTPWGECRRRRRYAICFLPAIGGHHHPELRAKRARLNSPQGVTGSSARSATGPLPT